MITLEVVTFENAMVFRGIRLRALRDTPSAFSSSYADVFQLTDTEWMQRVAQWSGKRSRTYLAMDTADPCRIALWSNYAGAGDALRFVRVGTLDEPDRLPPDIHIYTSSKQPWVVLPEGTPAVEEYYQSAKYWPKESLERRRALFVTKA